MFVSVVTPFKEESVLAKVCAEVPLMPALVRSRETVCGCPLMFMATTTGELPVGAVRR